MVVVSVLLRFVQEFRSNRTVAKLRNLVGAAITVLRTNDGGENCRREVPIREIVAGDIVLLSAGDMVPADVRLLSARDLFVSQSVLSGEALPVEKFETLQNQPVRRTRIPSREELTDLANLCFMGRNVVSGTATAVAIATGDETLFASSAPEGNAPRFFFHFCPGNKKNKLVINPVFFFVISGGFFF